VETNGIEKIRRGVVAPKRLDVRCEGSAWRGSIQDDFDSNDEGTASSVDQNWGGFPCRRA
jgi:hypothetical protein